MNKLTYYDVRDKYDVPNVGDYIAVVRKYKETKKVKLAKVQNINYLYSTPKSATIEIFNKNENDISVCRFKRILFISRDKKEVEEYMNFN